MNYWIVPSKTKKFNLPKCLEERGYVDWRQMNNFQVGDIIYIYETKPVGKIVYKMIVETIDQPLNSLWSDMDYWSDPEDYKMSKKHNRFVHFTILDDLHNCIGLSYHELKNHGMNSSLQGCCRVTNSLQEYIESQICSISYASEIVDLDNKIIEGAKIRISVNKYERNPIARKKCIESHGGYRCAVCDINFEERYGEIGKDFIHVHHVVPISSIGKDYVVNYETDLVPVCPNCHAMLHRGPNGTVLTVDELKQRLRKM